MSEVCHHSLLIAAQFRNSSSFSILEFKAAILHKLPKFITQDGVVHSCGYNQLVWSINAGKEMFRVCNFEIFLNFVKV